MKERKNWFSKRGYLAKVIREQFNRDLTSKVKEEDRQHMKENGVSLVVT